MSGEFHDEYVKKLEAKLAEYESALERERKPDWEKWLNELADRLEGLQRDPITHMHNCQEAARQLRYMVTSFTLKANFVRYNLEIRKWWWRMSKYEERRHILADMESFMREHNIPLEKPL